MGASILLVIVRRYFEINVLSLPLTSKDLCGSYNYSPGRIPGVALGKDNQCWESYRLLGEN